MNLINFLYKNFTNFKISLIINKNEFNIYITINVLYIYIYICNLQSGTLLQINMLYTHLLDTFTTYFTRDF